MARRAFMRRIQFALFVFCMILLLPATSQVTIKGRTNVGAFRVKHSILSAHVNFVEPSGNGFLDAGETATVDVTILNTGEGAAKDVVAGVFIPTPALGLNVTPPKNVGDIPPGGSKQVTFSLSASADVSTQEITARIKASDIAGIQIEPQVLAIRVKEHVIVKDITGPEIELTEPTQLTIRSPEEVIQRTSITTFNSSISVKGIARDSSGVALVIVNGAEVALTLTSEGTAFWHQVLLPLGTNELEIRAIDKFGNENKVILDIIRQEIIVKGTYYALIIAVENYLDRSISELEYPIRDAEELVNVLTTSYTFDEKNVVLLKDADTRSIFKAFEGLRNRVSEDDNLLVFYAGHGYWDEELRQGYWLPTNAAADVRSEWLSNSTIRDFIRGIRAKHTLLISDACFSGGIFRSRRVLSMTDAVIEKIYEMPSRRALTSGALKDVPDRSVFVEYLIKRLKENEEKYLYTEKLYVSMKDAVINNSPNNQTPLYGVINESGDEGGDFIFVRR
jgi:hypothetical protein